MKLLTQGENHLEWFKANFDTIIEAGQASLQKGDEFTTTVDNNLKISTGATVSVRRNGLMYIDMG